ncbi:helix-turn-helix domain-containing protein [Roseibium aggregatum]|uniref:helix-turn-helix domain-containing protein n=1 Tax=Roseibium aggregatum TaxID=187304 RepID=UPI0009F83788|nr:helix-turn-helix domain-containing protein [Roseibium aggregatum]UFI02148.1 helix-turn-helix domain-containing protein [Roseibium aggregatum]
MEHSLPRRHDAKGRRKGDGQYINLPYSLLRHPAWRSLSGPAVKVFFELRSRFNGGNNGKLHLSLDEAANLLGMSKSTVQRSFKELEQKGFIAKTKQGQWYGRQATEWQTTDLPCDGHLAKRSWQNLKQEPSKNSSSVLS